MKLGRIRYSWKLLGGDLSGGLIAALIALPYGLAMASLMGLPPVLGIFTSILTAPITALLGRNPVLIGGTSSVTVPFIAVAVKQQGIGGAAKVAIVASVFMMIFCVLRLGRHISKVPQTVVSGFSCGIGGMMFISQLRPILGYGGGNDPSTLGQLTTAFSRIGETRFPPLLLGLIVIGASWLLGRKYHKLPAPLIGVFLALGVSQFLHYNEKEVGLLSLDLPPFAGFAWSPRDVYTVLPSALGLAFVSSVNILITSRVVEHFRGWHHPLKKSDADAELGAYGIANVCAGMFAAPLSVGIPARSLAAVRCGASTRLTNLSHGIILALILAFGSGILAHVPLAALGGVTAWMGLCLLDWSTWRRIPRMRWADSAAFLLTTISVLFINAVAAVALGCAVYGVEKLYNRFVASGPDIPGAPAVARD